MRNRKQSTAYFIILLFVFSIVSFLAVTEVIAPPVGGSTSSGFITSIGSEIQITEATINMSITPQDNNDGYHLHSIQLQGTFNMTNPSSENESILLLYSPFWNAYWSFFNESSLETSIDGSPLSFSNQTLVNITHPREFPSDFHDRFPESVFLYNQTWFSTIPFTLMNLSFGPHQSIIFHFNDLITVTSISVSYTEVGFGLAPDQIVSDSTHIRIQITVINGTQFIRVNPNIQDHLIDSREGTDCIYTWDVQPPYSSQIIPGSSPYPIQAGFSVQMTVSEYNLTWETSTSTTSETSTTESATSYPTNPPIFPDLVVVVAGWGLFVLVIVLFWKMEPNK